MTRITLIPDTDSTDSIDNPGTYPKDESVASDSMPPPTELNGSVSVIGVMGVVGSGKSNLLRLLMGENDAKKPIVGHQLDACTQQTEYYETTIGGRQFILLDTPGFNDAYRGDADILADIACALSSSYKKEIELTGVIYLQPINHTRVTDSLMRNLDMFRYLCGDDGFKNVVLVTTFWDALLDQAAGEEKEQQLRDRDEWWGHMMSKGAKMKRSKNTRESAKDILAELVDFSPVTLQIQEEMVDQGLEVDQTAAGEALNRDILKKTQSLEADILKIQRDKDKAEKNHKVALRKILEKQESDKYALLREIESEKAALHADRWEERKNMEEKVEQVKARLEKKINLVTEESRRMKDDLEAEARESKERLKSEFNEELYAAKLDLSAQQRRQIELIEQNFAAEKEERKRSIQLALEKSNRDLEELRNTMVNSRTQDRKRFELAIQTIEGRQEATDAQTREVILEIDRLCNDIRDLRLAQDKMRGEDWRKIDERIRKLEKDKKAKEKEIWSSLGALAGIGALIVGIIAL